jgi:hypothetical protein
MTSMKDETKVRRMNSQAGSFGSGVRSTPLRHQRTIAIP